MIGQVRADDSSQSPTWRPMPRRTLLADLRRTGAGRAAPRIRRPETGPLSFRPSGEAAEPSAATGAPARDPAVRKRAAARHSRRPTCRPALCAQASGSARPALAASDIPPWSRLHRRRRDRPAARRRGRRSAAARTGRGAVGPHAPLRRMRRDEPAAGVVLRKVRSGTDGSVTVARHSAFAGPFCSWHSLVPAAQAIRGRIARSGGTPLLGALVELRDTPGIR